jgi:hypothetical protein
MKKKYLYIKYEKEYLEISKLIKSKPVGDEPIKKNLKQSIGFFLLVVINTAMAISRGIETLFRVNNYESALPLLRVLLECGIRIKAIGMADNKIEYCHGFGDVAAKNGKKNLSENAIVESLDKDGWTTDAHTLYKFLCKSVHLSSFHAGLLIDYDGKISVGRLKLKEYKKFVPQIEQCYDNVSIVVIGTLRYYIENLWEHESDQQVASDVNT